MQTELIGEISIPRDEVIQSVGKARWGCDRTIDTATFWRYCDALDMGRYRTEFYSDEYQRLINYAQHLNRGGTKFNFEESEDDNDCRTISNQENYD